MANNTTNSVAHNNNSCNQISTTTAQQQHHLFHHKSAGSWSELSQELSFIDNSFCSDFNSSVVVTTASASTAAFTVVRTASSKFTRQRERVSRSLDKY